MRKKTHLTCPTHRFPGFLRHTGTRTQLIGNPLRKEQLLKLPTRETLREIANEPIRSSCQSIRAFVVRKAPLDELQDTLRM